MAGYFGGLRDRLKKKARNLSLNEKDIEWLKVATSFSWSPARREYQWLEPEDYLSSFLNSSLPNENEHNEASPAKDDDSITFGNGQSNPEWDPAEEQFDYIATYEQNSNSGDESLHRVQSDILADLPHLDEYKLEISSALQRRGIHVEAESIQVPDELSFHLNNYHEKGRSSLDSYELRARLQYFKKQVIESYEQLSAPTGGYQPADKKGIEDHDQTNSAGLENLDEDEKNIVSSLDRLEASLREDAEIDPKDPPKDLYDEDEFFDANSGDSYSASFPDPPSSFADDSWLVLPIDTSHSIPESPAPTNDITDNEDELFIRPLSKPEADESALSDESKRKTPLFKSPKITGSVESAHPKPSAKKNKDATDDDENPSRPSPSDISVDSPQVLHSPQRSDLDPNDKKQDFSLFGRKDKPENGGTSRERKLFDSKRKTAKEHRKEVKLPELNQSSSEEAENDPKKSITPPEFRTEVKLPGAYRTEVILPGQGKKEPEESDELDGVEPAKEVNGSKSEKPVAKDAIGEDLPESEVSLSELLLKLRNESDLGINAAEETKDSTNSEGPYTELAIQKEEPDEPGDSSASTPVETFSLPDIIAEEPVQPLVDPLEVLAKPKKSSTNPIEEIIESVHSHPSSLEDSGTHRDVVMSPIEHGSDLEDSSGAKNRNDDNYKPENESIDSEPSIEGEEQNNVDSQLAETEEFDNETMDQRRARYIEEERKKLYSLIGRLEQNTNEIPAGVEHNQPEEIGDVSPSVLPVESVGDDKGLLESNIEMATSTNEKEGKGLSTDRAISLMDYIDSAPDEVEVELSGHSESDVPAPSGEVTDNLQQHTPKDISRKESEKSRSPVQSLGALFPRSESPVDEGVPPASSSVVPINEEEVVMSESQKDEQVSTAEVKEIVEDVENTPVKLVADTPPEPPNETVEMPSMDFDQIGFEFENLLSVVECLAFASEEPIPLKKIARIYSEVQGIKMPTEDEVLAVVDQLNAIYEKEGRSFRIKSWGRGIRMATHPQYANYIRALYQDNKPKKLSRTLMETLSIIAYSQPTTKPEVDFVRGVDSDYAVRKLLELGLIDIVGRSDAIGRPLLYGTSERFLDQFGLSEIEALPKLREVEELLGDPAFQKERLHLLALEGLDSPEQVPEEKNGEEDASTATSE